MSTTLDILKAARSIISDEKNWTQGTFAKDVDGMMVSAASPDATCFCSLGAILKVMDSNLFIFKTDAVKYLNKAVYILGETDTPDEEDSYIYNDTHEHSQVMLMWDKAIELAKLEKEPV